MHCLDANVHAIRLFQITFHSLIRTFAEYCSFIVLSIFKIRILWLPQKKKKKQLASLFLQIYVLSGWQMLNNPGFPLHAGNFAIWTTMMNPTLIYSHHRCNVFNCHFIFNQLLTIYPHFFLIMLPGWFRRLVINVTFFWSFKGNMPTIITTGKLCLITTNVWAAAQSCILLTTYLADVINFHNSAVPLLICANIYFLPHLS